MPLLMWFTPNTAPCLPFLPIRILSLWNNYNLIKESITKKTFYWLCSWKVLMSVWETIGGLNNVIKMWDSFSFYLYPLPPFFISYFLHLSSLLSFALASTSFQDLSMQETPVAPSLAALKEKATFHCTGSYIFKVITGTWLVRLGPHANQETRTGSTWPKPHSLRVEGRLCLEENQMIIPEDRKWFWSRWN